MTKLEHVAHKGESLLDLLRSAKISFDRNIANALLDTVDAVREILNSLETSGDEGDADYSDLVVHLQDFAGNSGSLQASAPLAVNTDGNEYEHNEQRSDLASAAASLAPRRCSRTHERRSRFVRDC